MEADISLQHSIILESAIAYLIQAIEDIFDKMIHNPDLIDHLYCAKKSSLNFPYKSLDLDLRHIILIMTY